MKMLFRSALLGSILVFAPVIAIAQSTPATAPVFSAQQLADGLKAGLGSVIQEALADGKLSVKPPTVLAKLEAALGRGENADKAAGFGESFKAVVAQVSPKAKDFLQGASKDVKFDDAKAVLSGGSDAATQYFKKHMGPAVREKLLPLVQQATASSSLAAKAKDMLASAGPLAGLGGNKAVADLDTYICDQVLAQAFDLMAKEEAAVRANPALLKGNPLAQQVFALFKK